MNYDILLALGFLMLGIILLTLFAKTLHETELEVASYALMKETVHAEKTNKED